DGPARPGAAGAGLVALHVLVAGIAPAGEAVAMDGPHPIAPAGPGPELGEGLVDARELRAAHRPAAGGACRRGGADRHGGGEGGPGDHAQNPFPRHFGLQWAGVLLLRCARDGLLTSILGVSEAASTCKRD